MITSDFELKHKCLIFEIKYYTGIVDQADIPFTNSWIPRQVNSSDPKTPHFQRKQDLQQKSGLFKGSNKQP
jgi:hypothetical protein